MIGILGIDIGFGAFDTGICFVDTVTKEIVCKSLPTKEIGWKNWISFIANYLEDFSKTYHIDMIGLEENYSSLRIFEINTKIKPMAYSVGAVYGWASSKSIKVESLNPSKINVVIGITPQTKRSERKAHIERYFMDQLSHLNLDIENNINSADFQDAMDSFSVVARIIYDLFDKKHFNQL